MTSYLYWRNSATKTTAITNLPENQKIAFDDGDINITSVSGGGTGNIITEPEFTPTGTKTYHKQEAGAITENVTIITKFKITQSTKLKLLRSFFRKKQIDHPDFPYGIVGFSYDLFDYFDVDPSTILGYTIEPPIISFGIDVEFATVTIHLTLGGKNLV
jgi:hypothetical protein